MWILLLLCVLVAGIQVLRILSKAVFSFLAEVCITAIVLGLLMLLAHALGLKGEEAFTAALILYAALLAILGLCVKVQESDGSQQRKSPGASAVPPSPLRGESFEPAADVMNWREGVFYFSYDEIHNCLLFTHSEYTAQSPGQYQKTTRTALHDARHLFGYYLNVNGKAAKEGDILANVKAAPLVFNSLGEPVDTPLDTYQDGDLSTLTLSIYFTDATPGATTGMPCKEEINFLTPDPPGGLPNYSTPRADALACVRLLHQVMGRNGLGGEI